LFSSRSQRMARFTRWRDGGIFAIAPDGKEHWKFPLPKSKYFAGGIAISNGGTVYLTTQTDTDSALTVLTPHGDPKQRYHADFGEPFVTGKTLVAADGSIHVTKNIMNRKLGDGVGFAWAGEMDRTRGK